MPRRIRRLGWTRDLPDHRDQLFSPPRSALLALPASFDLTQANPSINFPIYDQGEIGSCTANALAAAVQFDRRKSSENPDFVPSRLFLYYNERQIEGSIGYDSGAQLRDGVRSLQKTGICADADWPYDATPAAFEGGPFPVGSPPATQPPQTAYDDASNYTITSYQRLQQSLAQLQGALVAGFPFVFGFTVYDSWYDSQAPILPLPTAQDSKVGGHAVLAVGYDNATSLFKFRNSWGPNTGDSGYFYMPYAYIINPDLADDFWVINAVKD